MKPYYLFILLVMIALTSCGTLEMGVEPASANPPAASPTAIQVIPTQVATEIPTSLPVVSPTDIPVQASPVAPEATVGPQVVKIFFIALEDNGKSGMAVGCGDSVVPVEVQIEPTQGVLRAGLEALLQYKKQYYGESGLYNALYQSDLQVDQVRIVNGEAQVNLVGQMQLGGECDDPRFGAQIEQTVLQFNTVQSAAITINGKPLKEVLSLK